MTHLFIGSTDAFESGLGPLTPQIGEIRFKAPPVLGAVRKS